MAWFSRRRRRSIFDLFDEVFREIEEEFSRLIEEDIEELVRRAREGGAKMRGPYFYGVRITIGPDGVPRVEEFGNIKITRAGRPVIREEIEPMVDVIEHEDEVWVVADMPGVEKNKIKVRVSHDGRRLIIRAENGKKYYKEVELPAEVDPKSAKATYKNGVLEVKLKKKSAGKEEDGYEVKIE